MRMFSEINLLQNVLYWAQMCMLSAKSLCHDTFVMNTALENNQEGMEDV